jgi:hypothetical protein
MTWRPPDDGGPVPGRSPEPPAGRVVQPGYPGNDSSALPWDVEMVDGWWVRRERSPLPPLPAQRVRLDVQLLPRPREPFDVVACVVVVLGFVMAWALVIGAAAIVLYLAP